MVLKNSTTFMLFILEFVRYIYPVEKNTTNKNKIFSTNVARSI